MVRLLFIFAIFLTGCNAQDAPSTKFELSPQSTIRQISALDGNPLKVAISVNAAGRQIFNLPSVNSHAIDITGVRVDELNDINIVWYEILNGFDVEISEQTQQFYAEGDTNIDAPHQHTQFDYDGDGTSNYDERIAGTCVWSSDPDCTVDVPPSETIDTETIRLFPEGEGINVLTNPGFSDGRVGWTSNAFDITTFGGEYCLSSRSESVLPENASLNTAQGLFLLEPGVRYTFAAEVKAEYPSISVMRVQEGSPSFTRVHQVDVDIGTQYQTVSTTFIARDTHTVNIALWFGDGRANRYCVDNVVFMKGGL